MATSIFFVTFVSLLLRATFSSPISPDLKSVQASVITRYDEPSTRTVVFDPILNRGEDTEQVKSFDSVPFNHVFEASVKRIKRQVINGNHGCAEGYRWFKRSCVSLETYAELSEDYEDYD